jgi:hypothetical protein
LAGAKQEDRGFRFGLGERYHPGDDRSIVRRAAPAPHVHPAESVGDEHREAAVEPQATGANDEILAMLNGAVRSETNITCAPRQHDDRRARVRRADIEHALVFSLR